MKRSAKIDRVVAIDGPSGSGKSTIAKLISDELKLLYVDTGAMFRAIGYVISEANLLSGTEDQVANYLSTIKMNYGESPNCLIKIDGVNLTNEIRKHEVSKLASFVSKVKPVRNYLLDFQRELANKRVSCMEGRDIGTVVFPNAFLKIFLTASGTERAKRRWKELSVSGATNLSLEQIEKDIIERDNQDMNRKEAPLKKADDAILFNTDGLTIEDVVKKLSLIVREKANYWNISL